MQCPACQHVIDVDVLGEAPENCPECGATLAAELPMFEDEPIAQTSDSEAAGSVAVAAPVAASVVTPQAEKPAKPARSRGAGMLLTALWVFLLVGALTFGICSTQVAMRAIAERDQAKTQLGVTSREFTNVLAALANAESLKGNSAAATRREIFGPAIESCTKIVSEAATAPDSEDRVAAAWLLAAAMQAKTGRGACVSSLQNGFSAMERMRVANYDVSRFPNVNDLALKATQPMQWVIVEDASRDQQATGLVLGFMAANNTLNALIATHPQAQGFRSDAASLQRIAAMLQSAIKERWPFAIGAWKDAAEKLESLVRDNPQNTEYQDRLVEALVGAANLQRQSDEKDAAIANFKRAIEVREQMVAANPDNKEWAADLAKVKSSLEKLAPGASAATSE